eukprot:14718274-Alexandrium_andersonii.AAC.1
MLRRHLALFPGSAGVVAQLLEAYADWAAVAQRAPPWGPVRLTLAALPAGSGLSVDDHGQIFFESVAGGAQPIEHGPIQGLRSAFRAAFRRSRQAAASVARPELRSAPVHEDCLRA